MLDHELEEHTLKDVLHEAMQNMIATDPEMRDSGGRGGGCFGSGKSGSRSANLNQKELDSATKWLLERFGHDGAEDADGGDSDDEEVWHRGVTELHVRDDHKLET